MAFLLKCVKVDLSIQFECSHQGLVSSRLHNRAKKDTGATFFTPLTTSLRLDLRPRAKWSGAPQIPLYRHNRKKAEYWYSKARVPDFLRNQETICKWSNPHKPRHTRILAQPLSHPKPSNPLILIHKHRHANSNRNSCPSSASRLYGSFPHPMLKEIQRPLQYASQQPLETLRKE